MRGWFRVLPLLALVAACVPQTAQAAGKPYISAVVRGSHGYSIAAGGVGSRETIEVFKHGAYADYSHAGKSSAGGLSAGFGKFGKVSMHFHATKTFHLKPPKGCSGHAAKLVRGTLKGVLQFRGEHGYTTVHVRKAPGSVSYPVSWKCGRSHFPKSTSLSWTNKSGRLFFLASHIDGRSRASFLASLSEKAGSVSIIRTVQISTKANRFKFNSALSSASVSPSAPFHGTAHYQGSSFTGSLSGTLSVSFPGHGRVKLTGAGQAFLFHG